MGIYSNGSIFGIRIYNYNNSDYNGTLYEKKYDLIMSDKQKEEAYLFYNELSNKNDVFFKIYTECSSTYEKGYFMMWYPLSLNNFLEKFTPLHKSLNV